MFNLHADPYCVSEGIAADEAAVIDSVSSRWSETLSAAERSFTQDQVTVEHDTPVYDFDQDCVSFDLHVAVWRGSKWDLADAIEAMAKSLRGEVARG